MIKRPVQCSCGNVLLEAVIEGQEVRISLLGGDLRDTEFHCRNCSKVWELVLNEVQIQAVDMGSVFSGELRPIFRT